MFVGSMVKMSSRQTHSFGRLLTLNIAGFWYEWYIVSSRNALDRCGQITCHGTVLLHTVQSRCSVRGYPRHDRDWPVRTRLCLRRAWSFFTHNRTLFFSSLDGVYSNARLRESELIFKKRRDSTRLIYEILLSAERGGSKTRVIYRANLNFRLAEPYIEFLLMSGHIRREPNGDGIASYGLTVKGENFRRLLQQVEQELVELFPQD